MEVTGYKSDRITGIHTTIRTIIRRIVELVKKLRGETVKNQVNLSNIGMTWIIGGRDTAAVTHIQ